ncbi:MAG: hypothetical protein ABIG44_08195 [Planctomycetota bacterium]
MAIQSIVLGLLIAQQAALRPPEALRNFAQARGQLRTGRIACVVTNGPRIVGMPVLRYSMEIARNGDRLHTYLGDPEGVWGRDIYGYPMLAGQTRLLVKPEGAWAKSTWSFSGTVIPTSKLDSRRAIFPGGIVDLRVIGMAPDWDALVDRSVDSVLAHATRECAGYAVERDGSLHHVTVHYPDDRTLVYEIDAAKGWNATRISGSSGGNEWESIIELRETGGIWFPEKTTLYINGAPRTECVISEAAFNSPVDPVAWEPADIGFEVGMQVEIVGTPPEGKGKFWDGEQGIPYDHLRELLQSGTLQRGPTFELKRSGDYRQPGSDLVERLRVSPGVLASFVSTWEMYVVDFCDLYGLNREQVGKAYKCLHRAQDRADQYLSRRRQDFAELQKKRADGELSAEQAQQSFDKLRKPVDDIFENELKPALEKIPTQKQRDAAVERSKSRINLFAKPQQPARKPPEPSGKRP